MSYKMTKRELQHIINIKEAKTQFNIRGGERKGERDYKHSLAMCMRRNSKYISDNSIS